MWTPLSLQAAKKASSNRVSSVYDRFRRVCFMSILTRVHRFYCVEGEGRGADAVACQVAVEEEDGESYHQKGTDAG